jgi:hypothetical protein
MATQNTITAAEIETLRAQVLKMIDDLAAMESRFPVGSLWNAAGTAQQAVSGLYQELYNVLTGSAGNVTLVAG